VKQAQANDRVLPSYFTDDPIIETCIQKLKNKSALENGLNVSDVVDEEGNQYVELIQKGGGVWGIALVGYTYILEEMGIRFLNLAGTSAGAINTALLAVIGGENKGADVIHHKSGKKSQKILQYISELNMFDFVDGHPFAKWLIKNFIKNTEFVSLVNRILRDSFLTFCGLMVCNILFLGLSYHYPWADIAAKVTYIFTGLLILTIGVIVYYLYYIFTRLQGCGYGVNPGGVFYDWIHKIMEDNGVSNISTLNQKLQIPIPGVQIKNKENRVYESTTNDLTGKVSIITSELVSQNKIEFPKMWSLFKINEDELHPARFVRASMSIPVFFESHMIVNIQKDQQVIQDSWKRYFGTEAKDIPLNARFVDGGMLSNFPINIFYNPAVIEPRLPSFGINMVDQPLSAKKQPTEDIYSWDLKYYLGRMFNTMQNHYDKDFMQKNKVFSKGIGVVNLTGHNWLNFFVSNAEKKQMFLKGALAATEFLMTFDWEAYKKERVEMYKKLNPDVKQDVKSHQVNH